jgi:hypothetical protein
VSTLLHLTAICTWHLAFPYPDRRFGSDHLTAKMRGATHRTVAQSLGPDYVVKEQGAVSSDHLYTSFFPLLLRNVLALARSLTPRFSSRAPPSLSPCPQQHTTNCYVASFIQVPSPLFPQVPSGGTRPLHGTDGPESRNKYLPPFRLPPSNGQSRRRPRKEVTEQPHR